MLLFTFDWNLKNASGELDGLITAQPFVCQARSATDNLGSGIGLKSGHKE